MNAASSPCTTASRALGQHVTDEHEVVDGRRRSRPARWRSPGSRSRAGSATSVAPHPASSTAAARPGARGRPLDDPGHAGPLSERRTARAPPGYRADSLSASASAVLAGRACPRRPCARRAAGPASGFAPSGAVASSVAVRLLRRAAGGGEAEPGRDREARPPRGDLTGQVRGGQPVALEECGARGVRQGTPAAARTNWSGAVHAGLGDGARASAAPKPPGRAHCPRRSPRGGAARCQPRRVVG